MSTLKQFNSAFNGTVVLDNDGNDLANVGVITASKPGSGNPGSLDMRGGDYSSGSITTRNGGSIDTQNGFIELGSPAAGFYTRLQGTATAARMISLPDNSGTLALTSDLGTAVSMDTGWTNNADAGDKTASIPAQGDIAAMNYDLNNVNGSLGAVIIALCSKVKALEAVLAAQKLPHA